jgi:hypothetical protein
VGVSDYFGARVAEQRWKTHYRSEEVGVGGDDTGDGLESVGWSSLNEVEEDEGEREVGGFELD